MVDWISQLPDEVLISILSWLSMREAAATSIMSKRWKKLWTSVTRLDFDVSKTLDDIKLDRKLCEKEKPRYISWVNQVLDLHQSPIITVFRICFPLNQSSKSDIDRWLEIVMGKKEKVERFELDLKQDIAASFKSSEFYAFPYEVLVSTRHFGSFECLTNLCFRCVNVNEQVLQYFLSNCPLRRLCVEYSADLVNLRVTSPCLQLKYLKIFYCWNLEKIGILAPNLLSFKYSGSQINLPFNNLNNFPSLVEAYIGGMSSGFEGLYCQTLSYAFRQLSRYLFQLESLALEANACEANLRYHGGPCLTLEANAFEANWMFPGPHKLIELKQLTNLRRLVLIVSAKDYDNLLKFTPLIRASPCLQEFVLQLRLSENRMEREVGTAPRCPHMHLKVVELIGFVGQALDVELAEYLLENAIML